MKVLNFACLNFAFPFFSRVYLVVEQNQGEFVDFASETIELEVDR